MTRRALATAALAVIAAGAVPGAALAHEGNPDYRSEITSTPPGVEAQMLNHDDSIELDVEPGHEVVVEGYEDEPYVRFLADGTVEVNTRSPAAYLNEDRYADAEVPASADAEAAPEWQRVADQGRYAWHDHRVHYMATTVPGQVTDESKETKIFDWDLPVEVDGERSELAGTLYWAGTGGGASVALIAALAAAVLASFAFALWRIRRRGAAAEPADGGSTEAW